MPGADLPLPLYAMMLPDQSGPIFLMTEFGPVISLFTSHENLILFAQRTKDLNPGNTVIGGIMNRDDLRSFLLRPSSRAETKENFVVFIDPIAPDTGEYVGFTRQQLLDSIG